MVYSPEKPSMPSPEKPEEKLKTSGELIKEDKDLRAEFFKLRDKLEEKEISQEEKKRIKERLEEINKKCEPISKELDSKTEGLYSRIMDIPVRKPKRMSEEKWQEKIKKSEETLKETEEKLGTITDLNIKNYLEERIKQKREQLGITEVISPEPTIKEEIIKKPEKLKPEEISFEEKIKKKIEEGKPLSKKDITTWEKIKSQKVLEEMKTEIRELREKKQRGEVLSEEEKQRLELLKLKWDILQRSAEITVEKPPAELEVELTPEQEKRIEAKLEAFGLKIENLKEIEGLNQLSYGQRLLVLENLKQLSLGRIQEEAATKYRENTIESKFLGRIWRTISKKYQIAKLEKTTAQEIIQGGMQVHKETLQQLVNGTRAIGLEVVEKDGKLEIQYATGFEKLSPEEQKIVDNFNKVANEFSRMPYEWMLKTASKEEQRQYKTMREQYDKANIQILELRLKKNNNDLREASLYVNNIRGKVELNQFLTTHPEVGEQLQKIREKKTWLKALSNVATERGIYATAGFLTRSITTSLIGLTGIPLTAAGIGGWIAGKRAKEALMEREKMARKGVKDISREAKNFVDVENLNKKIDTLIQKIESEENLKEKERLVNSLKVRILYTEDKIEKGLVNFGDKKERLKNQIEIIQGLSRARVYVENYIDVRKIGRGKLEERLEGFLGFRERKISKTQRKYIIKQTAKGVLLGAGFALGGYALRHFAGEWFNWKRPPEVPPKVPPPGVPARPGVVPEAPPKPGVAVENIIAVQKGDSVWNILGKQLEVNYGQKFTGLNEAQKTYIVDALKDKIAENPKSFGLEDIDKIKAGQKINLSAIFEDKTGIENSFKGAGGLSQAQIEQIEHNNEILRNWLNEHPGQKLTSERIEEILGKGKVVPIAEVPAEISVPAAEISTAGVPTAEAPAPEILKAGPEVARIMDSNEIANIKALGFTEGEYKTIHNLTVGKLLEQIPEDKDEVWRIFGGQVPDKEIDLPHHGIYGATEFKRHLKLADFIRSFRPGEEVKEMTIRQFLRTIGPKGTIVL